jgi:hypothetical protein
MRDYRKAVDKDPLSLADWIVVGLWVLLAITCCLVAWFGLIEGWRGLRELVEWALS